MPEEYEIRVQGHLGDAWLSSFPNLRLTCLENGETLLSGAIPDQAALHGILERIRDLNLSLIHVERLGLTETPSHVSSEEA